MYLLSYIPAPQQGDPTNHLAGNCPQDLLQEQFRSTLLRLHCDDLVVVENGQPKLRLKQVAILVMGGIEQNPGEAVVSLVVVLVLWTHSIVAQVAKVDQLCFGVCVTISSRQTRLPRCREESDFNVFIHLTKRMNFRKSYTNFLYTEDIFGAQSQCVPKNLKYDFPTIRLFETFFMCCCYCQCTAQCTQVNSLFIVFKVFHRWR